MLLLLDLLLELLVAVEMVVIKIASVLFKSPIFSILHALVYQPGFLKPLTVVSKQRLCLSSYMRSILKYAMIGTFHACDFQTVAFIGFG